MKSRLLVAAVAFLGYAILDATPANAQDFTSVKSGNWCDGTVWGNTGNASCTTGESGIDWPGTGDSVMVSPTDDVTLTGNEVCGSLTINERGDFYTGAYKLTVEDSAGLDIDPAVAGDPGRLHIGASGEVELQGGGTHPIDGWIYLLGSGSELSISPTVSPLTMDGAGFVEGRDNGAQITIADGKRLTNDIDIQGQLEITGLGHFRNSDKVHASRSGMLNLNVSGTLDDVASTDQWIVDTAGAELRFSASANLVGEITVSLGTLDVQDAKSVFTTGTVTHSGGSIVVNGNGTDPEGSFGRS